VDYLVITLLPSISTIIVAIATVGLLGTATILYSSGKTEEKRQELIIRYPEPIVLSLRPLPHYKGYPLPLKIEVKANPDGTKTATATNMGPSAPEYNLLESSQKLEVMKGPIDQPMQELIAKFGVIRVQCVSGDALDCRADAKVRIIEMYGQVHPTNWIQAGYLDWFSIEIKKDIQQNKFDEIYPAKHLGLNKYLRNINTDLHQGDEKDLLVFYMIKDLPNVYLSSSVESAHAGNIFGSGQTLRFEIEIAMTARSYPKTTHNYFVTITEFDDFKIEPA
jgi:hypothetical protein